MYWKYWSLAGFPQLVHIAVAKFRVKICEAIQSPAPLKTR
jgi:hypothetical protein